MRGVWHNLDTMGGASVLPSSPLLVESVFVSFVCVCFMLCGCYATQQCGVTVWNEDSREFSVWPPDKKGGKSSSVTQFPFTLSHLLLSWGAPVDPGEGGKAVWS